MALQKSSGGTSNYCHTTGSMQQPKYAIFVISEHHTKSKKAHSAMRNVKHSCMSWICVTCHQYLYIKKCTKQQWGNISAVKIWTVHLPSKNIPFRVKFQFKKQKNCLLFFSWMETQSCCWREDVFGHLYGKKIFNCSSIWILLMLQMPGGSSWLCFQFHTPLAWISPSQSLGVKVLKTFLKVHLPLLWQITILIESFIISKGISWKIAKLLFEYNVCSQTGHQNFLAKAQGTNKNINKTLQSRWK